MIYKYWSYFCSVDWRLKIETVKRVPIYRNFIKHIAKFLLLAIREQFFQEFIQFLSLKYALLSSYNCVFVLIEMTEPAGACAHIQKFFSCFLVNQKLISSQIKTSSALTVEMLWMHQNKWLLMIGRIGNNSFCAN